MDSEDTTMLSYVKGHHDRSLYDKPPFAFADEWAVQNPDKEAYVFRPSAEERISISFKLLSEYTRTLAVWFLKRFSLKHGDRVAILSRNCAEYLFADLALSRLGVITVRIYATIDSKMELTRALERTDAKLLLCQSGSVNSAKLVLEEKERLPKLEHVVILSGSKEENDFITLPSQDELNYEDADYDEVSERQNQIKMTDDCTVYSTSGSTGEPKFVVYSYRAIANYPRFFLETGGLTQEDRYFTDRPMAHVGGALYRTLPLGATLIMASPWKSVGGAAEYINTIFTQENVTCGVGFPYLLYDLAQSGKISTKLKFLITGGQKTSSEVLVAVSKVLEARFINAYGCTELGEISCTQTGDEIDVVTRMVGLPVPGVEIKIVDGSGKVLPVGEVGKIGIRKQHDWRYLNDATKMLNAHDQDGYFFPGDIGRMDADNRLEVLGRQDDVISVGTVKMYPVVLETRLSQMEQIDRAVVFGVPDQRLNNVIGVAVLPKQPISGQKKITSDDVIEFVSQSVSESDLVSGDVILPKHVWIMDEFPQTVSGKIDKKTLVKACLDKLEQGE